MAAQFGFVLPAVEAVAGVALTHKRDHSEGDTPVPTPRDGDDALLSGARRPRVRLLEAEPDLTAPQANGRSWERIAELLGMHVKVARACPRQLRRDIRAWPAR